MIMWTSVLNSYDITYFKNGEYNLDHKDERFQKELQYPPQQYSQIHLVKLSKLRDYFATFKSICDNFSIDLTEF